MSASPQEVPPLGNLSAAPLGSLAQAARQKSLKQARWLLIIIGALTLVVNLVLMFTMREQVKSELVKLQAQGMVVDEKGAEAAVRGGQLLAGVLVALGAVFVVLGLAVKTYPVPITVTAFVLYVGAGVAMALLDPTTVARGLIIKVIIVVALVKAIQAAVAYEREASALTGMGAAS